MLRPNIRHSNNKQHKNKRRNISRRPNDKVGFFLIIIVDYVKEKFKKKKKEKNMTLEFG